MKVPTTHTLKQEPPADSGQDPLQRLRVGSPTGRSSNAKTEFVEYGGRRYFLQSTGRYFNTGGGGKQESLLHRRMWADANGPILAGYDVHHIDENWRHNELSNFELRLANSHRSEHMRQRLQQPENKAANAAHLDAVRPLASLWHASEEGRAWHSEHGKRTWDGREAVPSTCTKCGVSFMAMFPSRRQFCSVACQQSVAFRRYFTSQRQCAWCGAAFVANRHRKTLCCSRVCGNRKRGAEQTGKPSPLAGR